MHAFYIWREKCNSLKRQKQMRANVKTAPTKRICSWSRSMCVRLCVCVTVIAYVCICGSLCVRVCLLVTVCAVFILYAWRVHRAYHWNSNLQAKLNGNGNFQSEMATTATKCCDSCKCFGPKLTSRGLRTGTGMGTGKWHSDSDCDCGWNRQHRK